MSAVTKFLFETTFDIIPGPVVEEKPVADEPEDAVAEEEPEEFIPTFSEEEMKEAREQGFSNGKEEALRDALELVENKLFESLQRIDQNMTEIFSIQATTNEELPRASASIAVAMARKIVPELASRNAIDEIGRVVETAIGRILTEPRVTITVNSGILEQLSERLADIRKGREQEGRVTIIGDDEMAVGDCLLEWDNGGTERNVQNLWQDVDSVVERYLEDGTIWDRPETPDDTAPDEPLTAADEMVADTGAIIGTEPAESTENEDIPPEVTDEADNKD